MRADYAPMMRRALALGRHSQDLSTQIGGVLLSLDGSIIGQGWNDIPAGVRDTPERRQRPLKYEVTLHGECCTILSAARNGSATRKSTLVCPFSACANPCATTILGAGVTRLVRLPLDSWLHRMPNFAESVALADTMLAEAGVEIIELPGTFGVSVRVGGELVAY